MQEGHGHLLAAVLGAEQQTGGEVLGVVVGGGDIGVQILEQAALTIGGHIIGVGHSDGGQTGTGRVGGDQRLVDVLVSAHVLCLNGDEALGLIELLHDVGDQLVVLGFQRVPPGNGNRLSDLILACVVLHGGAGGGGCAGSSRSVGFAGGAAAGGQSGCGGHSTSGHQEVAARDLFHLIFLLSLLVK